MRCHDYKIRRADILQCQLFCQIQILYLLLRRAICRSIDVLSTYNQRVSSLYRKGDNITPPLNNSCYFFDSTVLGCDRRLVLGKFGSIDFEREWSNTFDSGAYFTEIREVGNCLWEFRAHACGEMCLYCFGTRNIKLRKD